MATTVQIEGQPYLRREPLGVLGLTFITFGIYFFYWYYMVNDEIRRFERDDTMSPIRSLMAMIFGWLIIVPPFIAMYNTAKHVQAMEQRVGVMQTVEPALVLVLTWLVVVANGVYVQDHLNRVWDRGVGTPAMPGAPAGPPLPPPPT